MTNRLKLHMPTHTTYTEPEQFRSDINRIVFDLFRQYEQVSSAFTQELYPIRKDTLHFIGKILKAKTPTERAIYRLLGRAVLQVETLSGGSAPVTFLYLLNLIRNLLRTEAWNRPNLNVHDVYEKLMASVKEDIQVAYSLPTEEDLTRLIEDICEDQTLATAVMETLKLAGIEGKIYIEDSKQSNYLIERKSGYTFKVKPFKFFLGSTNIWERQNVKVLLVDGVIDKVSEIDQLLRGAFEQKQSAIIVAREFSEEVVATLKANADREILDIVPIRINSDLESINILNDIASVCGTDIVSTLKGEMLCFKQWHDLPSVDRIRLMSEQMTIEESKTRMQVAVQVQQLVNKRQDSHVADMVDLFDERIKCLTGDPVCLRLPNMNPVENQAARVKIDVSLRAAKAVLNHNMVKLSDVILRMKGRAYPPGSIEDCVLRALETTAASTNNQKVSCLSAYLATYVAGKQALLLVSSAGAILSHQEE